MIGFAQDYELQTEDIFHLNFDYLNSKVNWEDNANLNFSDFKGTHVPKRKCFTDHADGLIHYNWQLTKNKEPINIENVMYQELSYIRYPNDTVALIHENIHFAISELFLRLCVDSILQSDNSDILSILKHFTTIQNRYQKEFDKRNLEIPSLYLGEDSLVLEVGRNYSFHKLFYDSIHNELLNYHYNKEQLSNYLSNLSEDSYKNLSDWMGLKELAFAYGSQYLCVDGNCTDGSGVQVNKLNKDRYIGEFKDNLMSGYGEYYLGNGDKYQGDFKENLFHGEGVYLWKNGDVYEGNFINDDRTGFGTMKWNDGTKYIGEWKMNKIYGKGTKYYTESSDFKNYTGDFIRGIKNGNGDVIFANGDTYSGEWKDGVRYGIGTYTWTDGAKYVGEWKDNNRDGQGTYTYAGGSYYIGEYKDNRMHGQGTYTIPDNRVDSGYFENDQLNGEAVIRYSSGNKYVGHIKKDRKCGFGTFTWADGSYYIGEYKDDNKHGNGKYVLKFKDGREVEYDGGWKDGKQDGYAVSKDLEGNIDEGSWIDNQPIGIRKIKYVNGDVYNGEYKNGKKDGYGLYIVDKWFYYIGEWENDEKHGKLLWTDIAKDTLYFGQWKNDKKHGYGIDRLEKPDRSVRYEGYFRKGRKHGIGKKIFESGFIHEVLWEYGEWVGNCLSGNCFSGESTAEYFSDFGDFKYNGYFKDGLWIGEGNFISNDETMLDLETIKSVWGGKKSFSEHWSDE